MAKSTDPQQQGQRQPERTVRDVAYMSVALLSHLTANVEVCDEIESFFYVSNFNDNTVANYIDEFSNQYGYVNDQYSCGDKKLSTIHVRKARQLHYQARICRVRHEQSSEQAPLLVPCSPYRTEYDRAPKDSSSSPLCPFISPKKPNYGFEEDLRVASSGIPRPSEAPAGTHCGRATAASLALEWEAGELGT
ncbi:hypothetical protein C8T65DRAFT_642048 [Cerioporus squamosus]|nr:hypothetical protein C8T65DRAFT_642048 [Cerioporus squamosus]